jgi:hypothetical protein
MEKTKKVTLSLQEFLTISEILHRVNNILIEDKELDMFIDNGDFIISFSKEEKELLDKIIKKF